MKTRALLLTALLAASALVAHGEDEPTFAELKRQLMFARTEFEVASALDALADRIGREKALPDAGAFGDWLGDLPSGKQLHPKVQQRRGWAYVIAKRGPEAVAPLQAALEDDPSSGLSRAYLGEALRQAGRHAEALEMLATALIAGERGKHVRESAVEAALALRRTAEAKDAQGLPRYASGLTAVIDARPDPELDATVAQWLLADLDAYDRPETARGQLWATAAAAHALRAVRTAPAPIAGSAQMAFDAARALDVLDRESHGMTERFDLLAHACRIGDAISGDAPHPLPLAFVLLGEAAAAERRYELAYRMARRRLALSWSPRAKRLLATLPPDIGADE